MNRHLGFGVRHDQPGSGTCAGQALEFSTQFRPLVQVVERKPGERGRPLER